MPMEKLQHPPPSKPQHSPHRHIPPHYGQQQQFFPAPDKLPKLNAKDTKNIQRIVGSFLYYARAVNPTILPALDEISYSQASPTTTTLAKCNQLMDYLHTHPSANLRFYKSDM